ncbi:MAG: alpha/beta fold hydrolase [Saprospiraceae bacterium]|nr:alpha/beta fold hydrolase [Saprospiraceae bacterium]MDW8484253.1 alpha/beta fold hydrolase [Saprospiraceae bacterium]
MKLYYREFGRGTPVVILHGLLGSSDNWQTIAQALAEEHFVITPDLRNHGRSPHVPTHSYPEMAEDLYALLDSLGIYTTSLVGHSMGGKVAMQFALTYPERVDHLVVIDIAPGVGEGKHEHIFEALHALSIEQIRTRQEADVFLQKYIPEAHVRQFLLKNLTRNPDGSFAWKMNLPVLWAHYAYILAPVEGEPFRKPTLFIRGGQSEYLSEEDLPSIKTLFPRARLETVEGAGHWVHADKPQELLSLLSAFLSQ